MEALVIKAAEWLQKGNGTPEQVELVKAYARLWVHYQKDSSSLAGVEKAEALLKDLVAIKAKLPTDLVNFDDKSAASGQELYDIMTDEDHACLEAREIGSVFFQKK